MAVDNWQKSSREPANTTNKYYKQKDIIDSEFVNPKYAEFYPLWRQIYETVELGEKGVKKAGEEYLPKTEGMLKNDKDETRYNAYKKRAIYRNFCDTTVKKAKGLMHSKNAVINLENNKELEYLKTNASVKGEGLESLLRNINDHQIQYSRVGLLADFPEDFSREPRIALYDAFSIIDWLEEKDSTGKFYLRFVLLDESGYEYDFTENKYKEKDKFRLLALADTDNGKVYYSKVFDNKKREGWNLKNPDWNDPGLTVFKIGGKTIDYIPFRVANIRNTGMNPENPLLIEQSNLAVHCYQNDADYRALLRLQAFALLVFKGVPKDEIEKQGVQADGYTVIENKDGSAGYESADGAGLQEMRLAIETIKQEADDSGIVINDKMGVESGKALTTRIALKTSDLRDIAITGAEALQDCLLFIAKWLGLDVVPSIIPNLDFKQETEEPRSLNEMAQVVQAQLMGLKNFYLYGYENNWFKEETFEEWNTNRQETGII